METPVSACREIERVAMLAFSSTLRAGRRVRVETRLSRPWRYHRKELAIGGAAAPRHAQTCREYLAGGFDARGLRIGSGKRWARARGIVGHHLLHRLRVRF
jgi:hypothetical protein